MIVLVFVKLAFNFTKGYMVHYANFMASRAFLVSDNNSGVVSSADNTARLYSINKVLKKIQPDMATNAIKVQVPGSIGNNVYVGVTTTYKEKFSLSPSIGGSEEIELRSESFLGRTPVITECARSVCNAISQVSLEGCGSGGNTKGFVTLWDNGC